MEQTVRARRWGCSWSGARRSLRVRTSAAVAILTYAARNPDKVEKIALELSQASTGSPVSAPAGSLSISGATRLTASEVRTGAQLAAQQGLHLSESAHVGAEFVDDLGRSYDAMGDVAAYASKNWGNGRTFFNSILKHVRKSIDYVAIDLRGASDSQIQAIEKYVGGLTPEQQAKIIYVR